MARGPEPEPTCAMGQNDPRHKPINIERSRERERENRLGLVGPSQATDFRPILGQKSPGLFFFAKHALAANQLSPSRLHPRLCVLAQVCLIDKRAVRNQGRYFAH